MKELKIFIFIICCSPFVLYSQQINTQDSINQLIKQQKYSNAIPLLKTSAKANPDNIDIHRQLALCYNKINEDKKVISTLEKFIKNPSFNTYDYQILAQAYRNKDKIEQSNKLLHDGMNKFPQSGRLLMEMGLNSLKEKKIQNAIRYWDKGIETEPAYDGNYYCQTKLFANTPQKIWAIFYGELFMCTTADSIKAKEISIELLQIYQNNIRFYADSFTVNITAKTNTNMPVTGQNITYPFPEIYEKILSFAIQPLYLKNEQLTPENICIIRKSLIEKFIETKMMQQYNNIVFQWNQNLLKNNLLDAYNMWLLRYASPKDFEKWKIEHTEETEQLSNYLLENSIIDNPSPVFKRIN